MGRSQSLPKVDFDQEIYFTNTRGQRIVCKYWKPETSDEKPRALVFIAHGGGEICDWYEILATPLTEQNILVFSHDQVGHGKSDGDRVHCNDLSDYTNDVYQHVDMMKEKYGNNVPVFIIGYSMGGTVAIKAAMDKPDLFKSVVAIAPSVQENPETATPFKVKLAKAAARMTPHLQVGKINPDWMCRNPAKIKEYEENPWCWHGGLKAKWSMCMLATMKHIQENVETISFPFLILHGTGDLLCLLSGSQLLVEKAASSDKTLKTYEGGYHRLHWEPDGMAEQVISDIVTWIKERS